MINSAIDKIPNPIRWILAFVMLFLIPELINQISNFISVVLTYFSAEFLFLIKTYIMKIIGVSFSILAAGWLVPKYKFRFVFICSSFYLVGCAIVLIMNASINEWIVYSNIIGSLISIIIAKRLFVVANNP